MKKILILGGSSDIGIDLINKLVSEKNIIHAQYNLNKPKIKNKNLKFIKLNLKNLNNLNKKIDNDYDVIINLVGYLKKSSFSKFELENIFDTLKINTIAMFLAVKLSLRNMIKKKYGRIINTSSVGVKFGGSENNFTYSISKHMNEFIPKELRMYSKFNIFYNVVRIGVTKTKIHKKFKNERLSERIKLIPVGKAAEPIDISNFIIFLIKNNNFITNQVIDITGGE
ncbi:SDR family NAD(P)-dependent oxidoreductase [Alphaproteobacteria bacterium]|jgi:3-oxoacyl-[acyl-carrier protein] reductase|nr:SDR family NAD(P)-dependent oxidoreductase [Alphaproteobacteria bacterium]